MRADKRLHIQARYDDSADSIDLLRQAVDLLASSPARLEEARARVDLGAALRRSGHRVESRTPLRDGYELAVECGADGLAETARSELRASGIRLQRSAGDGADSLTPSERRIADMAAGGLSNPEIAQRAVPNREDGRDAPHACLPQARHQAPLAAPAGTGSTTIGCRPGTTARSRPALPERRACRQLSGFRFSLPSGRSEKAMMVV